MTDKDEPKILTDVRAFIADTPPLKDDPPHDSETPFIPAGSVLYLDIQNGAFTASFATPQQMIAARRQGYDDVLRSHSADSMAHLIAKAFENHVPHAPIPDDVTDGEVQATIVPAVRIALAEMERQAAWSAKALDGCMSCGCRHCMLTKLDPIAQRLDELMSAALTLSKWLAYYAD